MYKLENNVEWTDELKTAFKKNITYGSLIFYKKEDETATGETIAIENNSGSTGNLTLKGNTSQKTTNGYQLISQPSRNTSTTNYGITYTSNANGTYRIRGTATAYSSRILDLSTGIIGGTETTHYSTLDLGDYNYNISNVSGNPSNLGIKPRSGTIELASSSLGQVFNIPNNITDFNLFIEIQRGVTIDVTFRIMLEKGNRVHSWEKYTGGEKSPNPKFPQQINVVKGNNTITVSKGTQRQTYPISFPENFELCKIGDYADEIVFQDNKWYKNKRINKIILDGSESWIAGATFANAYYTRAKVSDAIPIITSDTNIYVYCDKYARTYRNNVLNLNYACALSNNRSLFIKNINANNATELQNILAENNAIVYYPLESPVLEEITDTTLITQLNNIYNIQLYQGTNNINTTTSNEKPILTLNYKKNAEVNINESNYLKSIELKEHRYVPDMGFIGQATAKMVTINLTNEATQILNLENSEFELKIGAEYNNNIYYINYGNFIVENAPENDDTNGTIKFTAYDYMIKFNKPYEDTITYPCTLRALLLNVCNQAGIELMTNSFANENFEVENNQFEGKTLREVLQNIAKCAFTWARIRQDNKLYLDFAVSDTVVEEITINDYKQDNYKKANEYFGAVNKVTFADNDIEGQEESVLDQGDIILHGIHELVIKNNYFAYTTAKKRELIQAGSVLFGLKYMPIQDLKMVGLIYLESNDIIKVNSVDETYITSIPFCHTINYQGYTSDEIIAEGVSENQKEYENRNTSAESNSKAEFSVDRANKKIQSIVNQIGDRSEKQTTITQDIDGIELEVGAGLNVLDTIEKRGEIETEEAIDAQVYSIELKGTKEYVAYLHSGDGYSGDSYSNGGII